MLETLERSVGAQRQLVADASHELRTPITSMRMNIELLRAEGRSGGARATRGCSRRRCGQLDEMTTSCRRSSSSPAATSSGSRTTTCVSTRSSRTRSSVPALPRAASSSRPTSSPRSCVACRAACAGRRQPARQRCQVEPAGRHGRGHAVGRRARRPRPRPRCRARGRAARLRPRSTARALRVGLRVGPRARNRAPGRGRPRWHCRRRERARRRRDVPPALSGAPCRRQTSAPDESS